MSEALTALVTAITVFFLLCAGGWWLRRHPKRVIVTAEIDDDELIRKVARRCGQSYVSQVGFRSPSETDKRAAEMTEFCEAVIRAYIRDYQRG